MTITRLMLSTVLLGSLALPVLAQPASGAHQVGAARHHRVVRHAPVHRIATSPAAMPDAKVGADAKVAPAMPATRPAVGTTATVTPAPLGQPMGAASATPRVTPALPGTLATPALPGTVQAPRVTTAPVVAPAAKVN